MATMSAVASLRVVVRGETGIGETNDSFSSFGNRESLVRIDLAVGPLHQLTCAFVVRVWAGPPTVVPGRWHSAVGRVVERLRVVDVVAAPHGGLDANRSSG